MISHPLAVCAANESRGRRHAVDVFVLDQVRIEAWDRLLFVECGDGWIAEEAWRRARRSYACGMDTSPARVELARQLREVPGHLEFKTWDGRCLPLPDRAFDRVVATLALARSNNPVGLLHEVHRVLRPEGDVYLVDADGLDFDMWPTLEQAGFAAVCELNRSETALVVHARAAQPTSSA
jgi:ubiquinone/menaquinone biosynthesis C-methylase UbiE